MSVPGKRIGGAVRRFIMKNPLADEAVKRRFDAAVTAETVEELARHLRSLIQILKGESIPLDYPLLAVDLYKFQDPDKRDDVRLLWGQSYYSEKREEEENEQKTIH